MSTTEFFGFVDRIPRPFAVKHPPERLPEKAHYVVLDGLRGVASLLVVVFHLFESYQNNPATQWVNHGYLAVDFFFLLSGYVVGYAYDDRWPVMSLRDFVLRRMIRLQPMVVVGSLIGAALFYFQASPEFSLVANTPPWKVIALMLLGAAMIPVTPSFDIRGWSESYPLNGPAWSLFFEYIANFLYGAGIRRLPNIALGILVLVAATFLVHLAITTPRGSLTGGWTIDARELSVGFTRVMFPFFAGLLLTRIGARLKIDHTFAACSLLLVVALSLPKFGSAQTPWINGLYESLCVILVFPFIVSLGAGERRADGASIRVARFFGDLSYPLYITHYPLIYIYAAWALKNHPSPLIGMLVGVLTLVMGVLVAYFALKFYDLPVRRRLSRRFLMPKSLI
jgi:peptidoglycan/LPS O-acetylase OafA/YrhL